MEVRLLDKRYETDYSEFLQSSENSMFFQPLKFRDCLKGVMGTNVKDIYFLLYENEKIIAAVPAFVKQGYKGKILNSLPFYGSNGSIIYDKNTTQTAFNYLIKFVDEYCRKEKIEFATFVDTPFKSFEDTYNQNISNQFQDYRIGQVTYLMSGLSKNIEEELLYSFHQKTRNMVRKSLKNDLYYSHSDSRSVISKLYQIHKENMNQINGKAKPKKFFDQLNTLFKYDNDFRIYTAKTKQEEIVSCLLLFYFKDQVEYFTPAIDPNWRQSQALSGLIFNAMLDAIREKKSKLWNWGGTWETQDGVYRFKSRWGAVDKKYKYYTKIYSETEILNTIDSEEFVKEYPWFYGFPFNKI